MKIGDLVRVTASGWWRGVVGVILEAQPEGLFDAGWLILTDEGMLRFSEPRLEVINANR